MIVQYFLSFMSAFYTFLDCMLLWYSVVFKEPYETRLRYWLFILECFLFFDEWKSGSGIWEKQNSHPAGHSGERHPLFNSNDHLHGHSAGECAGRQWDSRAKHGLQPRTDSWVRQNLKRCKFNAVIVRSQKLYRKVNLVSLFSTVISCKNSKRIHQNNPLTQSVGKKKNKNTKFLFI